MKGSEYFDKLNKQFNQEVLNKAVLSASITVNSEVGERIFQKGLDAEGEEIGKYDTDTPLYVNPKNAPKKFPTKGKPSGAKTKSGNTKNDGKSTFEDGSKHKTGYFDSYTAYRKKVGRKVGKVILSLFGRLESDFVKGPKLVNGSAVITLNEENNNKRLGAEEKYDKKIFSLSEGEKQTYAELVVEQMNKYLNVK